MRILTILIGVLLCGACAGPGKVAGPAAEPFAYRPGRVHAGVVYHYTKSNIDGSKPWRLSMYVASASVIDVVKWNPGQAGYVNVTADMDWSLLMPDRIVQRRIEAGKLQIVLAGALSADRRTLAMQTGVGPLPPIPITLTPTHVYGFDLCSLSIALRHLKNPDAPFEVGLIDPNKLHGGPAAAVGVLRLEPTGRESHLGRDCRTYIFSAAILGPRVGTLWVDAAEHFIVEARHPTPTSTDWQTWRLELRGTEAMDPFAWERFKEGLIEERIKTGVTDS